MTEPGIYGVLLPMKKPFIVACLSSGIAGLLGGYFDIRAYVAGGLGIFSYPSYISPSEGIGKDFWVYVATTVLAFIIGFIMIMFVKLPKIYEEEVPESGIENGK